MGVPIEKRLGNVQKALLTGILDGGKSFDPNNPKDVKRRKELEKQAEALVSISSLVTDPTGGGLTGMTRVISKAFGAKAAKALFKQNKAKQIADLVTKPMTRGKKAASNTRKQAAPIVKEIVETKPTIPTTVPTSGNTVSDKIKSLYDQLSSGKPKQSNILESVKNVRELSEKQAKNVSTTISNTPVAKELWKKPLPTPSYTNDGFRIGGTEAKSILSKLKDSEAAKNAAKKAFEKGNAEIIKKGVEKTNTNAASLGVLAAVLGAGVEATAYGMRLSNKDKKQTTTPQKTGPVDLKRINPSKLKPSSIPGVSITKAMVNGKEKEFGIVWDNKTQSWDYYRDDKTKKTIEPEVVKKEDVGGGGVTPIKDNQGSGTGGSGKTTTGGGGATTPVKPAVTPVTKTYVGNEYAKANPDIEQAMQEDSIRQQRNMYIEKMSKPLSSLVFKTTSKAVDVRNTMDEQDALRSIREDNKLPLKKKRYGGNLAMLKYMK